MTDWVTAARTDELAPGQWRVVDVDGTQIVVFNIDGEYYAI
ncbi:MAG: Rieske (2Fe-2S) protein, partial [Burkholderiales bacterium]